MDTSVGNIQKDNNALKRKREEQQIMSEEPKGKSIKDMSGSIKKNSSNENLLELPLPDYSIEFTNKSQLKWYDLTGENLNCTYCMLLSHIEADKLLSWCEENIQYNSKEASKVRIMGKWHDIPRKQVAMGEDGLSYRFSGKTVKALPWLPVIKTIRDTLASITGHNFNFALINRYNDGNDYIGEHQDDEKELVAEAPIASLTLGQHRDFVFKHKDARGRKASRKIATKKIELQHGMLLLMNHPTNTYWYHSLPKRTRCQGVRINMTFRVFHPQHIHQSNDV